MLDLLIEFFDDGERWIKGKLDDGAGNHCLVGALREIRDGHNIHGAPTRVYLLKAMQRSPKTGWTGLISFNDRCRDFGELHEVILQAPSWRSRTLKSASAPSRLTNCSRPSPGDGPPLNLECCARCAPGTGGNVTRPRAADDFATIRARMKELRRERAPRAADDFAAIRARMEELRRERAQMSAARDARPLCPQPYGRQRRFLASNSSKGLRGS